jgi:competence protein ComFB
MDKVENLMEEMVVQFMDSVLKNYPHCCRCSQCRRDIAAIALNNLTPRYVSTAKGSAIVRTGSMDVQYKAQIVEEIAKAIEIVQNQPRHPRAESIFDDQ